MNATETVVMTVSLSLNFIALLAVIVLLVAARNVYKESSGSGLTDLLNNVVKTLEEFSNTNVGGVVRFTERCLLKPVPSVPPTMPRSIPDHVLDELDFSITLIDEEFRELREAVEALDVEQILKESADLLVVVTRMGSSCALPLETAAIIVSESNQTKLDDAGRPIFNEHGKYLKGPNYKKPSMAEAYTRNVQWALTDDIDIWNVTSDEYRAFKKGLLKV